MHEEAGAMTAQPAKSLGVDAPPELAHSALEDVLGILSGVLVASLGLAMYQHAGLLTGGIAGLAFLLHYTTGASFGASFFALNLPFYWLALRRMGWAFTLKTLAAVALLSAVSELLPRVLRFDFLAPLYAAVGGGLLIGMGFLMLFRHRASFGGIGVLAFFLQERHGWRAGAVQLAVDGAILLGALAAMDAARVACSVAGALVMNLVLAVNHRPGRYVVA
jgi:uncharacterized membrane-anchored protein YitT (DUF2179 family)